MAMKPKILLVMRHAKSDWDSAATRDFDRPLSRRGRRDAPRMGRWLQQQGYRPDRLICSPALRTRQTAAEIVDLVNYHHDDIIYEPMVYEASLTDLLAALRKHADDADTLMLLGHNPGLDELVIHLADRPPPRSETGKFMTTAAVAVLRVIGPEWSFDQSGTELIEIMRPRMLKDD